MIGLQKPKGFCAVVCAQYRLEGGGGYLVGTPLGHAPFHEEAIGDSSVNPHHEHPFVTFYPAAIIVIRNIQALMKSTFYAPSSTIALEPLGGIQPFWRCTGDQSHFLIFAPLGLAQKSGGLAGKRKTDVLGTYLGGANGTAFPSSFILLQSPCLLSRGFGRGENPLQERLLSFAHGPTGWVDFF